MEVAAAVAAIGAAAVVPLVPAREPAVEAAVADGPGDGTGQQQKAAHLNALCNRAGAISGRANALVVAPSAGQ